MGQNQEYDLLYWNVQETYIETIQEHITMSYRIKKETIILITKASYLSYYPPSPYLPPWCYFQHGMASLPLAIFLLWRLLSKNLLLSDSQIMGSVMKNLNGKYL